MTNFNQVCAEEIQIEDEVSCGTPNKNVEFNKVKRTQQLA